MGTLFFCLWKSQLFELFHIVLFKFELIVSNHT